MRTHPEEPRTDGAQGVPSSSAARVTCPGSVRRAARTLFGREAKLRWVHLVLGGALFMPFWLVSTVVIGTLTRERNAFTGSATIQLAAYGLSLPLVALVGLLPLSRSLSATAARALCGVPAERLEEHPAHTASARFRTAAWWTLHLGIGALISGASLVVPLFAVGLILAPALGGPGALSDVSATAWMPPAGVAMLLALACASAAAGSLLARLAPLLLGATPGDRLAAAERRATELEERNRVARELHDSVGHALSAVTLQAGAARKVLHSDLEFVGEALALIEETSRRTVGELDAVLGLLRQDTDSDDPSGGPTLASLDELLSRSGVSVTLRTEGPLKEVAAPVSREAYRIVQEGLSNALRHAEGAAVTLLVAVRGHELVIGMENPLPERAPVRRPGGGRGLRGVAERASLLGGRAHAEPRDGVWRLTVRLPLK